MIAEITLKREDGTVLGTTAFGGVENGSECRLDLYPVAILEGPWEVHGYSFKVSARMITSVRATEAVSAEEQDP